MLFRSIFSLENNPISSDLEHGFDIIRSTPAFKILFLDSLSSKAVIDMIKYLLIFYLQNFFQSMGTIGSDSLNAHSSILKYRLRNVARGDIEFDLGKFTIGYAVTYNSFMDRIDGVFQLAIPGVEEYRRLHNNEIGRAHV